MKLILHIGSGKTGTSSLQSFLARNSDKFKKMDVLYPVEKALGSNHILLLAGFIKEQYANVPLSLYPDRNYNKYKKDFGTFWTCFQKEIKRARPKVVILSAEQLFQDFSNLTIRPINELFNSIFDQIEVVVYLRSPVSDYVSRVSQKISSGRGILPPDLRNIRAVIEYYQSQFPGKVHVNAFEKEQLLNGNVIHDFVNKYAPELNSSLLKIKKRKNVSLPFELLCVLQKQRQILQPDGDIPELKTLAYLKKIARSYKKIPLSQRNTNGLILKPSVSMFLTSRSIDYFWLKSNYNVTFVDLDYTSTLDDQAGKLSVKSLSDIAVQNCQNNYLSIIVPSKSFLASKYRTSLFRLNIRLKRRLLMLFPLNQISWLK